jgi:thiamine-phosphate pyrophosphorylase
MARPPSSPQPILCAVLDGDALGGDPRGYAAALFAAGVDWIQLRDRRRCAAELFELARALVAARDEARASACAPAEANARANAAATARGLAPQVFINKRVDLALASGADGVHLGLDALEAQSVGALDRGLVLGASLHSIAELETAVAGGKALSYAQLAPIWDPRSKPAERRSLGVEELTRASAIAARAGILLLAQGGLDAPRAAQAVEAGAAGIAVTGLISQAQDPAAAVRSLRHALDGSAALDLAAAEAPQ